MEKEKSKYSNRFINLINRIHSAKSLDDILVGAKDRIITFVDADRMTIYGIDAYNKELYSKFMSEGEVKEIRVPISPKSISGYCAYKNSLLNVADVYNNAELAKIDIDLAFNKSWDEKTGYRTKQVLAAPIRHENNLYGVIQFINKKNGDHFTDDDISGVLDIANVLGIAFYNLKMRSKTKFVYLLNQALITENELNKAMEKARETKTDVESVIMNDYKIGKDDILKSLSNFYGYQAFDKTDNIIIPDDLLKGLNLVYLKKVLWIPVKREERTIVIAVHEPSQVITGEIKTLIKSDEYEFRIALKNDIIKLINSAQSKKFEDGASATDLVGQLEVIDEEVNEEGGMDESDSAIVRIANQIIVDGFKKGASDIHIDPDITRRIVDIRYRIDGTCFNHLEIPYSHANAMVSRIKIMSNLDISEKRLPQDGKIKFYYKPAKRNIELRVATVPSAKGENIVMRILAASEPIPLEKLRLSKWNYEKFSEIIKRPYGIVLVVGPTGSGKTTTLHSALGKINTPTKTIWTAEDPVEITQKGLKQVQVQAKIGYTFASAMRAFLRADPDIIMVGEMRDEETAGTGIEASLTGHLVFSTLHTNSAPETITRLLDMNLDPYNFADALLGILAQRLLKTLCKECRIEYQPSRDEFDRYVKDYNEFGEDHFTGLGIKYNNDFKLFKRSEKGCDFCMGSGYKGRIGVHEMLIGTGDVKNAIQRRASIEDLRKIAIKDGMRTLYQDGIEKVLQGHTDLEEVRNVVKSQAD